MTAEERRDLVDSALTEGEHGLAFAEGELERKPGRHEVVRLAVIVAVIVCLLFGAAAIAVSALAFNSAAATAARQEAASQDAEKDRQLAQQAYDSAQAANVTLRERGQAQVPVPQPDAGDPTATIVAAAAARVLASLPDYRPTAAQLGQAVAGYLLANPPGATAGQIAEQVANYLKANPPAAGPTGDPGKPGVNGQDGQNGADGKDAPPPSAQDIQDAFVAYIQANPEFLPEQLCANYGQNFAEAKRLVAEDGTRYTLYGCITEVIPTQPPETTPTTETP